MKIRQLSDYHAISIEPRKPYAYRNNKLRYKLLKSDKLWQCEDCGSKDNLQAHHIEKIKYIKTISNHTKQDPHGNHDISNGCILCASCHRSYHK